MFETVVIATDGSESAKRAITTAVDIADKFDATVHALYVIDEDEIESCPESVREQLATAIRELGDDALSFVGKQAGHGVVTATREGDPTSEIISYADEVGADVIVMGTRGRHGEHAFLLGSVAESVVRRSPTPVLTVRQLETESPSAGESSVGRER